VAILYGPADALWKEKLVPKLEVEDVGTFEVEEGKRLVLAIEEDAGVDILHRCGSYAKCTTCRIEYLQGEPEKMTRAELEVLESRDLLGQVRLSCQALCDHDMKVRVLMTVSSTGLDDPGPHPESHITPDWYFHLRKGGRQKTMYVGQTDNPEARVEEIMTEAE
jgi:ferredoxin